MMNSDTGNPKPTNADEEFVEEEFEEEFEEEAAASEDTTVVLDETGVLTDNVGDVSVEINVEELIADIEATEDEDAHRKKEIRRRLEEMAEEKSFEDTYAVDFDDE
jgi:hypothetical protein